MITMLMVYSLVVGVVIGVWALLADALARRAGIAQRFVWLGALLLLVVLTLSAPWRPAEAPVVISHIALPVGEAGESVFVPTAPSNFAWTSLTARLSAAATAPGEMLLSVVAQSSIHVPPSLDRAIGVLWAMLAVTLLIVLTDTLRRLDHQRRQWPLAELGGTRVRVGGTRGPAVYGVLSPDIVVPNALLTRSAQEQRLVLVHEDEHRRARDPLTLALTAGLVALLPWHPIAWWCAARVRLATELDCDARVLRRGTSARRYGALLLSIADNMTGASRDRRALALLDSRRHLERRIVAMTTRRTRRAPLAVLALSLVGGVAVFTACNTDVPTAAEIRDADAGAVVAKLGLPSGAGEIVYYVDGVQVASAESVPAEQIASIEVRRKRAAGEVSEVFIRTVEMEDREMASTVGSDSSSVLRRARVNKLLDTARLMKTLESMRAHREQQVESLAAAQAGQSRKVPFSADTLPFMFNSMPTLFAADSMRFRFSGNDSMQFSASNVRFVADSMRVTADSIVLIGDTISYLGRTVTGKEYVAIMGRWYDPDGSLGVPRQSRASRGRAAEPLVIVDGVIVPGLSALNRVHKNSIESVEVIKGEAARRIHGERGASGVIVVTTKRKL